MDEVTIVQISDIHVMTPHFSKELEVNVVEEVNSLSPDLLVVTGDLTDDGLYYQYEEALSLLEKFDVKRKLVVPGNHDSRNAGHMVFEELFGTRYPLQTVGSVRVAGVDSTEPDLDDGHVGRLAYGIVRRSLEGFKGVRAVALHHHLVPVPGTGRERNIPSDAGDFLKLLSDLKVHIVLCGHKHVPWLWRLNGMVILNAGTATTLRLKARIPPSFNVITFNEKIRVERVNSRTLEKQVIYEAPITYSVGQPGTPLDDP